MALLNTGFVFTISDICLLLQTICCSKTVIGLQSGTHLAWSTGMQAEVEVQPKFRRPGEGRRERNIFHVSFSLWKNHDKRKRGNGESVSNFGWAQAKNWALPFLL